MTRLMNLLIDSARFLTGRGRTKKVLPEDLCAELYNEAFAEVAAELYNEHEQAKNLRAIRMKLLANKPLTDKEALELGIVQL